MKKLILLLIAGLFFATNTLKAQIDDGWAEVGNAAYNSTLNAIVFTTSEIGFTMGTGGSFLKTENGGATWTAIDIGYDLYFSSIDFITNQTGFLVGNDRSDNTIKLLKTTNGGVSWSLLPFGNGESWANKVYFFNESIGFITGVSWYYKTTDGGITWTKTTLTAIGDIWDIVFLNTNKGFLTSRTGAYSTLDGGITWTQFVSANYIAYFQFTSALTGYMSSSNVYGQSYLKTTDGGATWNAITYPMPFTADHICFIDDNTGFAFSFLDIDGKIAKTIDGGVTWNIVMNDPRNRLCAMIKHENKMFACGYGGLIMKSTNMSDFTVVQEGLFRGKLNDMVFLDDNTAIAVGTDGVIVKTTDKCASWTELESGVNTRLWGICKTPSGHLYIVGDYTTLIKSTDGGLTWTLCNNGYETTTQDGGEIRFIDDNTGFITRGHVYKTTNAGVNWTELSKQVIYTCNSISIPDPDTIYISNGSLIDVTYDQGTTWDTTGLPASNYWGLDFIDGKNGIVAGHHSKCFSTSDGGSSWTTHSFATSVHLDSKMVDDQIWYAVGRGGLIRKTTNAGGTWDLVASGTGRSLIDIFFGPDGTGYILGEDGIILRKAIVETFTLTFNITENGAGNIDNAVVTLNGFTYPAGQYVFSGLLPGVFNWSISAPTFCTQTGITNVADDTEEMIVMDHCFQAIVTVTNTFSDPVEDASVTIAGNSQQTNAGGTAIFTLAQASNIPVNIEAGNYLPFAGNVTITSDTSYIFELDADIEAPVALAATEIQIHSFKANWTKPGNADSCLLYVSDVNDFATHLEGFNGKAYSGTSAVIASLDPNKQYFYRLKAKNQYGISEYSNSMSCTTLPVSNRPLSTLSHDVIYPNPATDKIFIKTAGISCIKRIAVYDIEGKCVFEDNRLLQEQDLISLDISFLKTGTYFIKLLTQDKTLQSVFIKK